MLTFGFGHGFVGVRRRDRRKGRGSAYGEPDMPYLVANDFSSSPAGQRFRELVGRSGILQMPGAHNGMAAIQAKRAGFDALYLSGAAMTASMGLPDLGIITVDEVAFFIRQIVRSSGLPLLVDGDTGYGKALVSAHDMAAKVAAAAKASREIVVIARTDAAGVEGFDAAVDRARLYVE